MTYSNGLKAVVSQGEQILNVAKLLLSRCDCCMSKDNQGYDKFDAITTRKLLALGKNITEPELEYLRQSLLKHTKQIREIGKFYNYTDATIDMVIDDLNKPICDHSLICSFQTKDGKWHFGRKEAKQTSIPPSDKSEGILEANL